MGRKNKGGGGGGGGGGGVIRTLGVRPLKNTLNFVRLPLKVGIQVLKFG